MLGEVKALQIQKSYQENREEGTLYIVPTPIGNLDDMTIRAINTLKEADYVLAEDTRNTGKLLHHFSIKKKMISYHEHNHKSREQEIIRLLKEGHQLALVSDAGMPGISDPGYEIIQTVIGEDLPVVVLPGASAAICGLVGSGLPTNHFYFYGFLPRRNKERKEAINDLKKLSSTFILYESPHRLDKTMEELYESLGNRRVSIARELTKKFEEYIRGTLQELYERMDELVIKGECCIIVEGLKEEESMEWEDLTLKEHVELLMAEEELSSKDAIKRVAKDRKIPKQEVYRAFHLQD